MAGYKKDGIYSWEIRRKEGGTYLQFKGTEEYAHQIITEVRKEISEDYKLICMNCRRSSFTEES